METSDFLRGLTKEEARRFSERAKCLNKEQKEGMLCFTLCEIEFKLRQFRRANRNDILANENLIKELSKRVLLLESLLFGGKEEKGNSEVR